MKESEFVERNRKKWQEFERELKESKGNPERIAHFYIETVEDLSFARTHYPNRLVRSYLNGLAEKLSIEVQKSQKNFFRNFIKFWKTDLPLIMYEARNQFLISFLLLAFSIAVGVFSSMHDPSFAGYILGEDYVNITIENIEKGDPMAIYKDPNRSDMFLGITLNNILVAARTFILSLFAGVGTLVVIIFNGVMLGVFQYFFIERGLFAESFLTIWQHGVIEISCVVLAGAAGLVLAKGILFPRTYSRLDAFRIAGRKSLVIMLGIMPLLVYSGAIEAFLTRYTDIHWSVRLTSILITLGFVIVYFVIYPRKVAKQVDWKDRFQSYLTPIAYSKFSFEKIEKNPAIIWEAFRTIGSNWKSTFLVGGLFIIGTSTLIAYIDFKNLTSVFQYAQFFSFFNQSDKFMIACNVATIALAFFLGQRINYLKAKKANIKLGEWKNRRGKVLIYALLIGGLFAYLMSVGILNLMAIVLMPAIGFTFTLATIPGTEPWKNFGSWFSVSYGRLILLTLVLCVVSIAANSLVNFISIGIFMSTVGSFIDTAEYYNFFTFFCYFTPSLALNFFLFLSMFTAFGLKYHGAKEAMTANSLRQKIEKSFPSDQEKLEKANLLSNRRLKTT